MARDGPCLARLREDPARRAAGDRSDRSLRDRTHRLIEHFPHAKGARVIDPRPFRYPKPVLECCVDHPYFVTVELSSPSLVQFELMEQAAKFVAVRSNTPSAGPAGARR